MGRIAKWGTRLGSFDVRYKLRNAIKGQVLVDFVVEFTPSASGKEWVCQILVWPWQVYVDGASTAQGAGIGIVLVSPEGIRLEHSSRLSFRASNNKAEYKAFIAGLKEAKKLDAREVEIFLDLHLVVGQVEGSFEARDSRMAKYSKLVSTLRMCFQRLKVSQISKGLNSHADSLAILASSMDDCVPRIISVEVLNHPSTERQQCVAVVLTLNPSWMDPIISFISDGVLPSEEKETKKIQRISTRFGCLRTRGCIDYRLEDLIFCVFTQELWMVS